MNGNDAFIILYCLFCLPLFVGAILSQFERK